MVVTVDHCDIKQSEVAARGEGPRGPGRVVFDPMHCGKEWRRGGQREPVAGTEIEQAVPRDRGEKNGEIVEIGWHPYARRSAFAIQQIMPAAPQLTLTEIAPRVVGGGGMQHRPELPVLDEDATAGAPRPSFKECTRDSRCLRLYQRGGLA